MIDNVISSIGMDSTHTEQIASADRTEKIAKPETASKPSKSERERETAPRKNDRVELSEGAREYLNASKTQTASEKSEVVSKNSADDSVVNFDTTELSQASDDEDISSSELYSYTDSELLDLVIDGSISRSDYNAELAKREDNSAVE